MNRRGNVNLADFGLAREYIAPRRVDARRNDGSWMQKVPQYYIDYEVGTTYWLAPEYFTDHYTTLFPWPAVFCHPKTGLHRKQRKSVLRCIQRIRGVGKVGPGVAKAMYNPGTDIEFSTRTGLQGCTVVSH